MCFYPTIQQNKKYTATKKNGGVIPEYNDIRVLAVPTACGRCMECLKAKSRDWQVRLLEEIKHQKNGKFVTLTFSNESIKKLSREFKQIKGYELDNKIAALAIRRFLERWRQNRKSPIRHWLITELGHDGTENIHLHGIIWAKEQIEEITETWKYGFVWPKSRYDTNYVNEKTIGYITKYITKQDKLHKYYKPKILNSKGIGLNYINRADAIKNEYSKDKLKPTKETYTSRQGREIALPKYLRNKIYTEEEREKLWIEKLDKQIRWVGGEKIDVSNGYDEYMKALKYHRKKAKRLGYNNNDIKWSEVKYENERREFNLDKRLND